MRVSNQGGDSHFFTYFVFKVFMPAVSPKHTSKQKGGVILELHIGYVFCYSKYGQNLNVTVPQVIPNGTFNPNFHIQFVDGTTSTIYKKLFHHHNDPGISQIPVSAQE